MLTGLTVDVTAARRVVFELPLVRLCVSESKPACPLSLPVVLLVDSIIIMRFALDTLGLVEDARHDIRQKVTLNIRRENPRACLRTLMRVPHSRVCTTATKLSSVVSEAWVAVTNSSRSLLVALAMAAAVDIAALSLTH